MPAVDEPPSSGSGVFGELTTIYAQFNGITFMGEYEVVDGRVLLSSADFGEALAGLDGQAPEDVAARLIGRMVSAAVARGQHFMRNDETSTTGA